ncbi:DoxX family protein [Kaistia dalseonensis]|uniref:Oxidoreductase n=1 Tax=Kaistia dalseonensis TaxID=410840 RepID=A0ABU0HDC4_9HYPH|nr:DoxX family protein [Kaistia dalseonensis]MCX5497212.1 DoxX family protein [Kaistia dalseonensis]MDQ0439843.1 putative oxidoreductase [Kaistia dalseonensis]
MDRVPVLAKWQPEILSLVRIATALIYFEFATAKLFGFPYVEMLASVEPFTLFWYAAIIELIGSPLLLVGLFTGPVALILSGEMAFAYFLIHGPQDFFPIRNGGIEAALFCFIFFYIAAAGPGAWSLDRLIMRRRSH